MNYRYVVLGLVLVIIGWNARGWFEDAKRYDESVVRQQERTTMIQRESEIAKIVESKLQELKENERTIIREVPKIIVRDVYRNVCLDSDGMRIINDAARGISTKPAEEMPGATPDVERNDRG